MFVLHLLEDLPIRHVRGARRFAREAADTLGRVKIGPGILSQSPFRLFAPQAQPTSRRVVLIARQFVGRTNFEAKATVNAACQQVLILRNTFRSGLSRSSRILHEMFDSCSRIEIQFASNADGIAAGKWRECQSPPIACSSSALSLITALIRSTRSSASA